MDNKVIFYKFNNNTQETDITECNLEQAHDLYIEEVIKYEKGISDYNYFDITVNGKLLRSFNKTII